MSDTKQFLSMFLEVSNCCTISLPHVLRIRTLRFGILMSGYLGCALSGRAIWAVHCQVGVFGLHGEQHGEKGIQQER